MMVDVVVGYLHCWGWMSVIAAITNSKQTFHFIASLAHKSYQLSIGRSFLIRYLPHPVLHKVTLGGQHSSLLHFMHWFIIVMGVVGSVTGHCVPNEECVTRESFIRNRIIITTGIHILLRCGDRQRLHRYIVHPQFSLQTVLLQPSPTASCECIAHTQCDMFDLRNIYTHPIINSIIER